MAASSMTAEDFMAYPAQARALAAANLAVLASLPPALGASLLRELMGYDYKFPAERAGLSKQVALLAGMTTAARAERLKGFGAIMLSPKLAAEHYARNPAAFLEKLTAELWSSGQMTAFRQAASEYNTFLTAAAPTPRPATRRLGVVVIGQGAEASSTKLFRKLQPHGLMLTNVQPKDGFAVLLAAAADRVRANDAAYQHWYVDGGVAAPAAGLTTVSYAALQEPLKVLIQRIQSNIDSGTMNAEGLRTAVAALRPQDIGLPGAGAEAVLGHFTLSLLTEGSGTQIFSTTFVQWAARECLRRAQPETLVSRYAPRREQQPMNVMLSAARPNGVDAQGSLVDADMGAYYTWLNMNRLSGADEMSFLVWREGTGQALAVAPSLPQGTSSDDPMDMQKVLRLLG